MIKQTLLTILLCVLGLSLYAQPYSSNLNGHSHNDYVQQQPFHYAHQSEFGSIEMDIFLRDGELYVAHEKEEIEANRTLKRLYLNPLLEQFEQNKGVAYKSGGRLQFLIDLKTAGEPTLRALEKELRPIRHHFDLKNNPNAVRLVISGDMPQPADFQNYDEIFHFDGRRGVPYSDKQLARIPFFSAPLSQFTKWNGLGRIPEPEYVKVKAFVDSVHRLDKKVRFWGNPDTKTTWQAFLKLGVDYINTDSPAELATFLNKYERNAYQVSSVHKPYQPTYQADGARKAPKNVILLISDGAGWSQLWAAATANGGQLNATTFKHIGQAQTAPTDDYNTDSAAGATALSTGTKTRNRYIGVDSSGKPLENLPDWLREKGIISGIITNDRLTGATPSSFFAHRAERDLSDSIAWDILESQVSLFIGGSHEALTEGALPAKLREKGALIFNGLDALDVKNLNQPVICFDRDDLTKDYRVIESAFDKSVALLNQNKKGFFLMIEGAKIDGGGHSNNLKQSIDEYLSFDRLIGKALEFADKDGETLVVVTSDHETGGLILVDGNYETGFVLGSFTTNDHTGTPVPVLAYGPSAQNFSGFLQNTDVNKMIKKALGIKEVRHDQ